mmetsp:Transcript_2085/g.5491  ORF Transcript_2085/g.5491 Transcript_2085/m.5491 type:complete len:247 (-) Transcript_2085:13-753(-)
MARPRGPPWFRWYSAPPSGSPTARLIRFAMGTFVLLQSPLFTLRVEDGDSGSVRKMHMSAMQVCGIAAHATGEPAFVTLTTVGLMPGTMLREATKTAVACLAPHMLTTPTACNASLLLDGARMWHAAEVTEQLLADWHTTVGDGAHNLLAASSAVVVGGLTCFVTPVKMMPVGLFLLLVVLLTTANVVVLPNLLLMNVLAILMFVDGFGNGKQSKPAAAVTTSTKETGTKTTPTASKQRKRSKGRT